MQDEPKFRSISVSQEDYLFYNKIAKAIGHTNDLGIKVSIAQAIRIGMTFYNQRRNFVDPETGEINYSKEA